MDFREIVRDAAKRKLIELAKVCLDIIDELKKEESSKVSNFVVVAEENGFGEKACTMKPFLFVLNEEKKDIIRKRILDKTNELARELDN